MTLVSQVSKLPTRKVMAVILSGLILGAAQSALQIFWPDHPFAPYMEHIDFWLQGAIMAAAGYMTREKEYVVVEQTSLVQEPDSGGDTQLSLNPLWEDEAKAGTDGIGKQVVAGQGTKT